MKKIISAVLAMLILISVFAVSPAFAAEEKGAPSAYASEPALYVHAVIDSADTEAWQAWQSVHDEDYIEAEPSEKYFFLPSSADDSAVDVYNGFGADVTLNGVKIASGATEGVPYETGKTYTVTVSGTDYTLKFMKSNAEGAVYINNPDADGSGTDLMTYLNKTKDNSAKATGAIVTPDGAVNNTAIKKIKGRGNTSWDKPKKGYNITYDKKVSIAGMESNKKYSILPNYQDDSLSRNRILYDLSDAVGLPYASDSRYVDFYVNGYYWGSYLMCEKIEAGSLVTDVDDTAYLNEDGTVKEDFPFILEVDASAGAGDYWFSAKNMKITIKAPEIEEGEPGYNEVKAYAKSKFEEFYDATGPSKDLSAYADIDSVAKLYLINELGKNWDSGVSSTFFTYRQDASGAYKFYGSPVWDYDNSLGNATGVMWDLRSMGVTDYEEYTGWWCRYKGLSNGGKRSSNIIARISLNKNIIAAVPKIWFEKFVPALNHFSGEKYSISIDRELYTKDEYYDLIKGSADMNYTSGWLLNTGSWIADHSSLYKASYDASTEKMTVDTAATRYADNFDDMYDYASDWMLSRAAWLSEQYAPDYTPSNLLGDANLDGDVNSVDATWVIRSEIKLITLSDEATLLADVNKDGEADVVDATLIQRYDIKMDVPYAIGEPV